VDQVFGNSKIDFNPTITMYKPQAPSFLYPHPHPSPCHPDNRSGWPHPGKHQAWQASYTT